MTKFDLRTPIIYVLTVIIVILLIILKKMDDRAKEQQLEKKMEQVEIEKEDKPHKISPEIPPPALKGKIGIIIDDFGYRNDEVSDGFLKLNVLLTSIEFSLGDLLKASSNNLISSVLDFEIDVLS